MPQLILQRTFVDSDAVKLRFTGEDRRWILSQQDASRSFHAARTSYVYCRWEGIKRSAQFMLLQASSFKWNPELHRYPYNDCVKAITAATTHFIQFRIQYASIALLYWDYSLTFPNEVKYIWTRKSTRRLSSGLYILCRYALIANVLYLLAISGRLGSSCNTWYKFIGGISVVARAAVLTVFTMRTYAMWSRNKYVLGVLGVLAVTCVVLDCLHVPGLRCQGSLSIQIANTLLSILMCVFEFFSTALTTFRCIQAVKEAGSIQSQKRTLTVLILEQGVLYFGLVTSITIAAVILNFRAPSGFFQRLLNALILPLSGLLTARFLLHLRAWDSRTTVSSTADNTNPSTGVMSAADDVVFASQTTTRSILSEFGDDPVVFARSHGSSTQDERLNRDDEAKQWMPMDEIPSGSDRDEQHSGEEHASRDA